MSKDKLVKAGVTEKISESSKNKEAKAAESLKPYVHISTFLQTAVPLFNLNSMQAQGFKMRMNGRHYQRDEQVFVAELKKYLNLK